MLSWLNGIFPKTADGLDDIKNRAPKTGAALAEAGAGAAGGADGVGVFQNALEKLKQKLDAAKQATENYRQAQDQLLSEAAQADISKIDVREAQGLLSPTDARKARAGVRLQAVESISKTDLGAIDEQAGQVRAEQSAAFNKLDDAQRAAEPLAKQRDELRSLAMAALGLSAEDVTDPQKVEAGIQAARKRLAEQRAAVPVGETGRDIGAAIRAKKGLDIAGQQLDRLEGLRPATEKAEEAERAAALAKHNYEDVFAQTSPRLEQFDRARDLIGYRSQTARNQNAAEILKAEQERKTDEARTNWNAPALRGASGLHDLGAALQQNTDHQQENGRAFLEIVKAQNQLLQELLREAKHHRSAVETLRSQVGRMRNG